MSKLLELFNYDLYLEQYSETHGNENLVKLFPKYDFKVLFCDSEESQNLTVFNKVITNYELVDFISKYKDSEHHDHKNIISIKRNEEIISLNYSDNMFYENIEHMPLYYRTSWEDYVIIQLTNRGIGLNRLCFDDGLKLSENICLYHYFKNTDECKNKFKNKNYKNKVTKIAEDNNWEKLLDILKNQ